MPTDNMTIKREGVIEKLAQTLYLSRPLINGGELVDWAKQQGFKTTMPPEAMHTTLAYSKAPFEWDQIGLVANPHTSEGGDRSVQPLGDGGAVVLKFDDPILSQRWAGIHAAGASSDFSSFTPHVTLSWDAADVDLSKVEPFTGPLQFGPEVAAPLDPDWQSRMIEKARSARVIKVNLQHGIVFGWAIVCKIDGEDYYDLNIDADGEIVPENVTENAMLASAVQFAGETHRPGNEMHAGPDSGTFDFLFPVTTDIADALEMKTRKTGLLVGYKPTPEVLAKFANGTYTGFSIEGMRGECEELGL